MSVALFAAKEEAQARCVKEQVCEAISPHCPSKTFISELRTADIDGESVECKCWSCKPEEKDKVILNGSDGDQGVLCSCVDRITVH
ncbi:hypothetical protein ABFA07_012637 [Porites harrisoni]